MPVTYPGGRLMDYFGPKPEETEVPPYTLEPLTAFNDLTARPAIALRAPRPAVDLNEPIEPAYRLESPLPDMSPELRAMRASERPAPATRAPDSAPVAVVAPPPTAPAGEKPVTEVLTPKAKEAAPEGDDYNRLLLGQSLIRASEGLASATGGRDVRSGAAEALGERMKQIEALRLKKEEEAKQQEKATAFGQRLGTLFPGLKPEEQAALADVTKSGGIEAGLGLAKMFKDRTTSEEEKLRGMKAILDFQIAKNPEQAEKLRGLEGSLGAFKDPNQLMAAIDKSLGTTEKLAQGRKGLEIRAGSAEDLKNYRLMQLGRQQAELDLKRAEAARKQAGSAEPTPQERNAFQTAMKPANSTATALKDAAELDTMGEGMLKTGKPPAFLSRQDIAQFNGGDFLRSRLAESNPKAYDLLTRMAQIKTVLGHEYFGSALSPSEAERQRQFMDVGVLDSPESVAKKMKNYRDTLANKAKVWLNPLVAGRPQLGSEWLENSGLAPVVSSGGTFEGVVAVPPLKGQTAAAPAAASSGTGKVRMLSPDGRAARIPENEVEARKAQGWKEAP